MKKANNLLENYFVNSTWLGNAGFIIGSLLAANIVTAFSMSVLWHVSGIIIFFSGMILFFAPDCSPRKEKETSVMNQMKQSVNYVRKHPTIRPLIIATLFFVLSLSMVGFLFQPYLFEFGVPDSFYGYTLSLGALLSVAAPILAKKIKQRIRNLLIYFAATILILICVMLIGVITTNQFIAMLVIALVYSAMSYLTPLEENFFQQFLPSKMRSTIGSVKSMGAEIASAMAILIAGVLSSFLSVRMIFLLSAVLLLPTLLIYFRLSKNHT
ncbi:MFS transporter [Candidatus Woesearchaeota archaeon]|nr:MAG: MFS transporter [Candidatus Woesearchaeota archaeon]